jgi:hypothetical protein
MACPLVPNHALQRTRRKRRAAEGKRWAAVETLKLAEADQ